MGKGDKKSKKGKIFLGSYGKTRLHKPAKGAANTTATATKKAGKKAAAKA